MTTNDHKRSYLNVYDHICMIMLHHGKKILHSLGSEGAKLMSIDPRAGATGWDHKVGSTCSSPRARDRELGSASSSPRARDPIVDLKTPIPVEQIHGVLRAMLFGECNNSGYLEWIPSALCHVLNRKGMLHVLVRCHQRYHFCLKHLMGLCMSWGPRGLVHELTCTSSAPRARVRELGSLGS